MTNFIEGKIYKKSFLIGIDCGIDYFIRINKKIPNGLFDYILIRKIKDEHNKFHYEVNNEKSKHLNECLNWEIINNKQFYKLIRYLNKNVSLLHQ